MKKKKKAALCSNLVVQITHVLASRTNVVKTGSTSGQNALFYDCRLPDNGKIAFQDSKVFVLLHLALSLFSDPRIQAPAQGT